MLIVTQGFSFTIVSYNCENLFDCKHDSLKEDYEFLPEGEREWNFGRYWKKLNNIGRVIHQCGGKGEEWRLPDIVVMIEVENDSVMRMLTHASMLKTAGYRYVMTNSDDLRGVDVALMYNPYTFMPLQHSSLKIFPKKGERPTRDVLYVKGLANSGDTLHVFALHAPSRAGGQSVTENYRVRVTQRVLDAVDSIRVGEPNANFVILGDFNDYSYNKTLKMYGKNNLVEISNNAVGKMFPKEVLGTYKYQREWESLDHIVISSSLKEKVTECYIFDNKWILQKDAQGGYKPYRTYLGPYYNGGVSDHLPLVLNINL
ncbi:MAG: endonuclease [Prevotella sp.]|nr:endonuclease [Candidatus Prevotella equi]